MVKYWLPIILTAYDVVASFDYVRNYPYAAASRRSIVYYEAVNELTVRINTVEPNALLFHDLTHSPNMIMPRPLVPAPLFSGSGVLVILYIMKLLKIILTLSAQVILNM